MLSEEFSCQTIDLKHAQINPGAIKKVPARFAYYYKIVPVDFKRNTLTVAVASVLDVKTQDEIRTHLGCDIEILIALEEDVAEAMKRFYGIGADTLGEIGRSGHSLQGDPAKEETIENIEELYLTGLQIEQIQCLAH